MPNQNDELMIYSPVLKSSQLKVVEVKSLEKTKQSKGVVVLIHGLLCDFSFWISRRGFGFAAYLASKGYEVIIPQWQAIDCSLEQLIENYLMPWLKMRLEQVQSVHVVGHSYGGLVGAALAKVNLLQLNSLTLLATQDEYLDSESREAIEQIIDANICDNSIVSAGKYVNQPHALRSFLSCYELSGLESFNSALTSIKTPVLALSGVADKTDPVEYCERFARRVSGGLASYHCLSVEQGFRQDYNHLSLLIGMSAQKEVWPKILVWLNACN